MNNNHIRETYPHIYSVVGVRYIDVNLDGRIYLTKKHAEEELKNHEHDQSIMAQQHNIEKSPDLLNLLDFVTRIDLENSQIVLKQN